MSEQPEQAAQPDEAGVAAEEPQAAEEDGDEGADPEAE